MSPHWLETRFPKQAFTLLEICLAIAIVVMIMGAAVPTLRSVLEPTAGEQAFEAFDALAQEARRLSQQERAAHELAWEKGAIHLRRTGTAEPLRSLTYAEKEVIPTLSLPAALLPQPPQIWTFWPDGLCEPALVHYAAGKDQWRATYNPFSSRPVVSYGQE